MTQTKTSLQPGKPSPLGATWDGKGVNFALFSEHAEKVELCLFNQSGERETARLSLPEKTGHIWHGYMPNLQPGDLYGYRVYGPYAPQKGHRFNHHKLLIDPYTKLLNAPVTRHPTQLAYDASCSKQDLSFCSKDSAAYVPKCVITPTVECDTGQTKPRVPWPETILYESHVRGFTISNAEIPETLRGKFAGMAQPVVIDYLKDLGISSIELLPVQGFANENFLHNKGLSNYWGYNSLTFFAPENRYANSHGINEFRDMVSRYHDAGIEVILDVVYNHTAEGDQLGPTLSFRGIDNAAYYQLDSHDPRFYVNQTGCGNTLNITHPQVRQLVLDSLRYWVEVMGVNGFRFDLAPALGRETLGHQHGAYNPQNEFFVALSRDPLLSNCKLIAEPWDVGPNGYQLGNFPPRWAEWNDRFRDTCRKFWRGDQGMVADMAKHLHGSSDLFQHGGRQPWSSINFVTAHDGFTLNDLVSYNHKHNTQNLEDNRDGHNANYSANYGVEGATDNPDILQLRQKQQRNLLATTVLSQGTPMLLAGDEFHNSQQGNNNAYCQDNPIGWLNWQQAAEHQHMIDFVAHITALKKRHSLLRWDQYLHSDKAFNGATIQWLNQWGSAMTIEQWQDPYNRFLGCMLAVDTTTSGDYQGAKTLLLLLNSDDQAIHFSLPDNLKSQALTIELDTCFADGIPLDKSQRDDLIAVEAQSLLVVTER